MNKITSVIRNKPVALQVEEILRDRIRKGVYPPDQRMPSEDRLAEELQVSRASLRTAMAALAAGGYINRRHGDGTYVRARAVELNLRPVRIWDIERQIRESGRTPSLRVLEQAQRAAQPLETGKLGIDVGHEILVIRRLFLADDEPVGLVANYMRTDDLKIPVSPDTASLAPVDFLEQYLLPEPRNGQIHFSAILADEETASLFKVDIGHPLLFMEAIVFDPSGRPIIYGIETYLGWEGFQLSLGFS
jgi:GntR family transcriptional regulator